MSIESGQQFGRLLVIGSAPKRYGRHIFWNCRCECGHLISIPSPNVIGNGSRPCKCPHRPLVVDGELGVVCFNITQGKTVFIDAADVDAVIVHRWQSIFNGKKWYARAIVGRDENGGRVYEYLHRFLMTPPDDMTVDHEDGNGLNCRRRNMRVCTLQQNNCNVRKAGNQTSRFKGVQKSGNLWRARIGINGEQIQLGGFHREEDAARAYDAAAFVHHGEFAAPNFPLEAA